MIHKKFRPCKKVKEKIEFNFYYHIKDLSSDWDEYLPEGVYLKSDNLLLFEKAKFKNIIPIFGIAHYNNQIVACAAFQIFSIKKDHFSFGKGARFKNNIWAFYTKLARPKIIVAGNLFRHDIQSFYSKILNNYDKFSIYSKMIDTLIKTHSPKAVIIKDLNNEMNQYFLTQKREYMHLDNDASMSLRIDDKWRSINDYELDLKHKYGQRFRNIRKQINQIRFVKLTKYEVKHYEEQIYELYLKVVMHQNVRTGFISKNYITLLKEKFEDEFLVFGYFEANKMIGFFTSWHKDANFDMFYLGFDYEANKKYNLYFNMLFSGLEEAISLKCKEIIYGRTALEAKARVGACPTYLPTFLFLKNILVRKWIKKNYVRFVSSEEDWESRHPFR